MPETVSERSIELLWEKNGIRMFKVVIGDSEKW